MAEIVVMPQLGNTVESCVLTAWRVVVGDVVETTTIIAEIETDKSAMEVPAGVAGTVLALLAESGDEVPVKAPLLVIGQAGEDITGLISAETEPVQSAKSVQSDLPSAQSQGPRPPTAAESDSPPVQSMTAHGVPVAPSFEPAPISPRALRAAQAAGVDVATIRGSGPHGRIMATDVEAAIAAAASVRHTRAAATQPPVASVVGSGIGGRVTRQDLASAAAAPPPVPQQPIAVPARPAAPPPMAVDQTDFPGDHTDTPLAGVRKLVATRMMASLADHAQLTFDTTAPATALLGLRARFKSADPAIGMNDITIGDLVAFAAARCALAHPAINATITDQVLRTYRHVHLGLATDTPRGLLVPTIRFASQLGLKELSAQAKDLAAQARQGSINPDLLAGGTFTVTNLGGMGIESFTPILNSPQTAILGVNAIRPWPVRLPDGTVGIEQRIGFSLTVDHAVVDGADAARYLQALVAFITDIDVILMAESSNNG